MKETEKLSEKKIDLLHQLTSLGNMRKGSVTEQVFKRKNKDGSCVTQGPYFLYSYKDKTTGKTISKRLSGFDEANIYRSEIKEFRCFEQICAELTDISHRICDLKHISEKKKEKKLSTKK